LALSFPPYRFFKILMFASMIIMLVTGRHIFGIIGFVAAIFSVILWGKGGEDLSFHASFNLLNWYPLLTLPMRRNERARLFLDLLESGLKTGMHSLVNPVMPSNLVLSPFSCA
jgi:hypothetical protein